MIASCVPRPVGGQVWALDGPQGLASPGAKVRRCEIQLRTPGRTPDVLPAGDRSRPFQGYIRSSVDLFSGLLKCQAAFCLGGLNGLGYSAATLFEVFPGAEWTVLTGKRLRKKATQPGRSARRSLFERFGIRGLPALPTADQNDALVGAYLAWCTRHRTGMVSLVGSPAMLDDSGELREGMILHATEMAVLSSAEIEVAPEGDGPLRSAMLEPEEHWTSGDSARILVTDTSHVHGTVPENKWGEMFRTDLNDDTCGQNPVKISADADGGFTVEVFRRFRG